MLPTNKEERKKHPIWRGVLMYFPRTFIAMARCSWQGNEQHNPGQPLHWARNKSDDHEDCMIRHMLEGDTIDDDGIPHCVKAAWRACARAELILEKINIQEAEEVLDGLSESLNNLKSDHQDILWQGKKIGYTVASQVLFTCPFCHNVVSQSKRETKCRKCGKELMGDDKTLSDCQQRFPGNLLKQGGFDE